MIEIKNNFINSYNAATTFFNNGAFMSFFQTIRPVMENLAYLLISDLTTKNIFTTDFDNPHSTFAGEFNLPKDDSATLETKNFRELVSRICRSVEQKHDTKKDLVRKATNYCRVMFDYYLIATEFPAPAKKINCTLSAQGCILFILSWLNFLKSNEIISKNLADSFVSLEEVLINDKPIGNWSFRKTAERNTLMRGSERASKHNDYQEILERFPGLEDIVADLLDNQIPFDEDGGFELIKNGVIVAEAAIKIKGADVVIVDDEAQVKFFNDAGYKAYTKETFDINEIITNNHE